MSQAPTEPHPELYTLRDVTPDPSEHGARLERAKSEPSPPKMTDRPSLEAHQPASMPTELPAGQSAQKEQVASAAPPDVEHNPQAPITASQEGQVNTTEQAKHAEDKPKAPEMKRHISLGDKIGGSVEVVLGKILRDEKRVEHGEARKHGTLSSASAEEKQKSHQAGEPLPSSSSDPHAKPVTKSPQKS